MSSIVIAGDTSGSVTLQAPAVSGSTVLNLPATSGTIQASGAGYTTNGVAYATSATGLATSSALSFNGAQLGVVNGAGSAILKLDGTSAPEIDFYSSGVIKSYIYAPSTSLQLNTLGSNPIIFLPNEVEGMRLTSTGLGIGTSSPSTKLHINNASATATYLRAENTNGYALFGVDSSGNAYAGAETNDAFGLVTNGTYRLYIEAGGNIGIGTSSPSERLDVGGFVKSTGFTVSGTNVCTIASSNANSYVLVLSSTNATPLSEYIQSLRFTASAPNNTSARFLEGGDTGGDRFVFRSNGGLANYSANDVNLSDRREKINFAPAGSYLDKICAIPVQTFNYIDQNLEQDGGLTLGVVAQDVQAVAPELVMENNWAGKDETPKMRLSIYQTDLQYALMKCIQEQQALITTLTERITALEGV
jgi:hypothetical protein